MGLIIGTAEQIQQYFDSPALNQSTLKNLSNGLMPFLDSINKKYDSDSLTKGSIVDTILTGEEDSFEKQYYVSTLVKLPSEVEQNIVKNVYEALILDKAEIKELEDYPNLILRACGIFNWQKNWSEPVKINKIIEAGKEYFRELKLSANKKIISTNIKDITDAVVDSLKMNPTTSTFFDRETFKKSKNVDVYYQVPIYFTYKGVECKALPDILIVDKVNKKVFLYDLKTMSGYTLDFYANFKSFRYGFQAAWYYIALKNFPLFKDYAISSEVSFIVESTTNIGQPLIYTLYSNTLMRYKEGVKDYITPNGYRVKGEKGIDELIETYKKYQEQGWQTDLTVQKYNGRFTIDDVGVVELGNYEQ
jgi:hypothetical protein